MNRAPGDLPKRTRKPIFRDPEPPTTVTAGAGGVFDNERGDTDYLPPVTVREKRRPAGGRFLVGLLVILLFFAVLSVVMTRPVLTTAADHTCRDPYDPTFQAWTLDWDLRALGSNPLDLFNANIFFPNEHTLAFSDHQVVNAVIAAPAIAWTNNPVQAQNYMVIFAFLLCAVGAFALTTHLTGNRLAGVVAGVAFAFSPPRLSHVVHLNILSAGWIPLCLLFMHRYSEKKRVLDAALAALFFTLQVLTTWYYGMILAVALLVFLVVRLLWNHRQFTLKWTVILLAAFMVAGVLITPFTIPYLKVQKSDPRFVRNIDEVDMFSADITDFVTAPTENLLWGKLTAGIRENTMDRGGPTERTLFPGLLPLLLGLTGAVLLFVRGRGEDRFCVRYYVTLMALGFVLCLGTSIYLFGRRVGFPMPYELFYHLFPGFKVMRVATRFVSLIGLSLAVLSGFAVRDILLAVGKKRTWLAGLLGLLIVTLLVCDLMSASIPMFPVKTKDEFAPVYGWLKERSGEAPTVELPLADYHPDTFKWGLQYEETWVGREPLRTYYSILHWKKLFNGYSSFIPTSYYEGVYATRDFPSEEAIAFFRKEGIEYVVIHTAEYDPLKRLLVLDWMSKRTDVPQVAAFGPDHVYRLTR
ncbi:MAG: hypothetical protein V1748_12205 [Actinomycetota bacterium]